jgi:potassium-transporting ATPase KdpC subunit
MKKEIVPSLLLSIMIIVFFCIAYPVLIWAVAQTAPNKGDGYVINANGKQYYENIAQKFTADKYFWSRPSAVDYNAAGSGGSNKGPSNPDYLADVQKRIDTFVAHNPGIKKSDIPSDLVTASGSGLDPDISVQGATVQIPRVAKVRGVPENIVRDLVAKQTEKPLAGLFGPKKVNVLKLNLALDALK